MTVEDDLGLNIMDSFELPGESLEFFVLLKIPFGDVLVSIDSSL